ncbi:MAG: c-type cytochrome [Hydrogenovibrio sp.]|uniref:c-type cytochrome n=1 Tax=Hydrogenovibrio sp. TaxID=2065821 RepID=UPI002870311E|nr:c-type cytochrome [Hydrogenovibrio sp.]MDR9498444.1 c-type cytochrome [Hydrogenovibrio sp.]
MKQNQRTSLKKWLGLVFAGSMMMSGHAYAQFDRASMLADSCVGCHGVDGISSGPAIPSIAGMSEYYFKESMHAYRDGDRPSTIMQRIAKGYTDEDIEAMAKYFSDLNYVQIEQKHNKKVANIGAKLHDRFCSKCHEDAGTLPDDDAGFLSGQMKPYLQYSMDDFTSGHRDMERKMKRALDKLDKAYGDDGITALIEYYASGEK